MPRNAAYHDSCSSLREMDVSSEPRLLLKSVSGLSLRDFSEKEACCGFGGFLFGQISGNLGSDG